MSFKDFKTDRSQDPGAKDSFEELLRRLGPMGPEVEAEYRQTQEEVGNPYINIGGEGRPSADLISPSLRYGYSRAWDDNDLFGAPDSINIYTNWLNQSLGEQYLHEAAHMDQVAGLSNWDRYKFKTQHSAEIREFGRDDVYGWRVTMQDDVPYINAPLAVTPRESPISGYGDSSLESSWDHYAEDAKSGDWFYPVTEGNAKKWKLFREGDASTIEADAHMHRAPVKIESLKKAHARDVSIQGETDYKLFDKTPQEKLINPKSREDVRENAMWILGIDLPPVKERDEGLNNKLNKAMNTIDMISIGTLFE